MTCDFCHGVGDCDYPDCPYKPTKLVSRSKYTIEPWDEEGYYVICEDGTGLARTKSQSVAKRIVTALTNMDFGEKMIAPLLKQRLIGGPVQPLPPPSAQLYYLLPPTCLVAGPHDIYPVADGAAKLVVTRYADAYPYPGPVFDSGLRFATPKLAVYCEVCGHTRATWTVTDDPDRLSIHVLLTCHLKSALFDVAYQQLVTAKYFQFIFCAPP